VIIVIVGNHEIVDGFHAGLLCDGRNAAGIAAIEAAPPCVHQKRFAGRADHERGLTAFYIREVETQRRGLRACR
jgi:hypothetical protein